MSHLRAILEKPHVFPIYIGTGERDRLFRLAKNTAKARGETTTALIVRGVAREVLRCQAERGVSPVGVQHMLDDLAEQDVLALLDSGDQL
jgi:hypothetical protein